MKNFSLDALTLLPVCNRNQDLKR